MYATVTVKWKIISYVDRHEWHEGMRHMCSCRHARNYSGMAYDLTRWYHYSKGCLMREQNIERWAGPGNKASVLSTCVCVCAVLGRNFYCVFHLYVYTTLASYPTRLFVVCLFFFINEHPGYEASTTSANRYEKIYNSQLVPALKQKVPS